MLQTENCGPSKPKLEWLCELLSVICCMNAGRHPPHRTTFACSAAKSVSQNPRFSQELKLFLASFTKLENELLMCFRALSNLCMYL